LLVDGWKSFFFITQGQSTQHSQSSQQSASWLIFSTLRVEIFLLVDGWKSFSLLRRDTGLRSIPIRVSQSPAWYFFLPLGSKYSCWWMVGNPFFITHHAGHPSRVESVCQLDDIFSPLGSKYSCWWMVGNPFLYYEGYSLRSIPIRVSQSASWLIFFYP
jgi:hypothetical protein